MISKSVFIKKKRIMEQFSLEKYLANPSRKVVTRDGCPVQIICTDAKLGFSQIIALIKVGNKNYECIRTYTKNGKPIGYLQEYDTLFFAPETHEGWINVYRNIDSGHTYAGAVYDSKEDAEKRKIIDENYVTTIKIEWEE